MKVNEEQIKLVFRNRTEDIAGILDECVSHILKGGLSAESVVIAKIKWVVTELLTNSIKHSKSIDCIIKITINVGQIVIEKRDRGAPLELYSSMSDKTIFWPISNQLTPFEHVIYSSNNDTLVAHIQDDGWVTFSVYETDQDTEKDSLITNMGEHFGLLIIAKSSSEFSYRYESDEGINSFTCKFDIAQN